MPQFNKLSTLLGGKKVQSGNNVSFSNRKTKRKWFPNVVVKHVYSELLDKAFRVNITTNLLRTIDKKGGFDRYVLLTKDKQLDYFSKQLKPQLLHAFQASTGKSFSASKVLYEERVARAKAQIEKRDKAQPKP